MAVDDAESPAGPQGPRVIRSGPRPARLPSAARTSTAACANPASASDSSPSGSPSSSPAGSPTSPSRARSLCTRRDHAQHVGVGQRRGRVEAKGENPFMCLPGLIAAIVPAMQATRRRVIVDRHRQRTRGRNASPMIELLSVGAQYRYGLRTPHVFQRPARQSRRSSDLLTNSRGDAENPSLARVFRAVRLLCGAGCRACLCKGSRGTRGRTRVLCQGNRLERRARDAAQ